MIKVEQIGTDGWEGVPDMYFDKSVTISHNIPIINKNSQINVLCLLESESIVSTFNNELLSQFDLILTWRKDIYEKNLNAQKFLYGTKWVEEMSNLEIKENKMSFLISNKIMTSGHEFRHEVFNILSGISNSSYDIEFNFFKTPPRIYSKNEILDKYKFSIVMENDIKDNYFTEKIIDCFATKTVPIYWGCKNIGEYFDSNGIITFNDAADLIEIVMNLNSDKYLNLINNIENNYKIAKQYYFLWERINKSITIFLDGLD
jgi:hypothetical protein